MLRGFILAVHVLLALMIIGLVLLQRGKGAEAGAGFGSGASGTVFGARGTSTLFSKLTAVFAALFFVTSLSLAYLGTRSPGEPTSVLERSLLISCWNVSFGPKRPPSWMGSGNSALAQIEASTEAGVERVISFTPPLPFTLMDEKTG